MRRYRFPCVIWLAIAVGVLGGCAGRERVVLLPGADGKVGKVAVIGKSEESIIDQAYEEARLGEGNVSEKTVRDDAWAKAQFGDTLAAMPMRAKKLTLYFMGDSDELTDESKREAESVLAEIARTPFAEVVVIGHTDTMGERRYNDQLSRDRARVIERLLMGLGVDHARMKVSGRGERELLVDTPDETPEPKNRRVEIDVR